MQDCLFLKWFTRKKLQLPQACGCYPWALAAVLPHIPVHLFLFITHTRLFQRIKMSGLLRGIARVRAAPVLRGSTITQRANITTRPAKDKFGPVVSICRALRVSSAACEGQAVISLAFTFRLTVMIGNIIFSHKSPFSLSIALIQVLITNNHFCTFAFVLDLLDWTLAKTFSADRGLYIQKVVVLTGDRWWTESPLWSYFQFYYKK